MKNIYKKIAPALSKISLGGLIVGVVGLLISAFLKKTFTDPWDIFYASWAERICLIATFAFASLYVVFAWKKLWPSLKEGGRKFMVSLKRNPSMIPLVMMLITFLYFSLNLTDVSDTTAKIQGNGMGLSQFCVMLFSLLSMVCMLNAFPRRKKPNIPMIVLMFVMFAVMIYCDLHYIQAIDAARFRAESPIVIDEKTIYIALAYNMLNTHWVLTVVCAVLVALLPVYSKLLRKINTSIDVEDNGEMETLELND